ncbi:MAG TPA: ABC transporter ATP-binding protein [Acidimicrobiia bacterium]|nr:ABC transporter ATP-binding protein [Acidimicrobiia bacterium]
MPVVDGVRLRAVTLVHRDGTVALDRVDVAVEHGEILGLVGPSGSGKTSLLRVVAGLEKPESGSVEIDGLDVTALPTARRDVAMIFQEIALIPQRTAASNISFPLEVRRVSEPGRSEAVERERLRVGLGRAVLPRLPSQLSAGHRQLVAAGRALVRDPKVLLADEPLAHLDAEARRRARIEFLRIQRDASPATLYATNDPAEAMTMADRVAVLNQGSIVQVGTPLEVYSRPSEVFVGRFFGLIPMNIIPAVLEGDWRDPQLRLGGDLVSLGRQAPAGLDDPVLVGIRPEHLRVAAPGTPFDRCLHGTVELVESIGPHDLVRVRHAVGAITARAEPGTAPGVGSAIEVMVVARRHIRLFDPGTERALE